MRMKNLLLATVFVFGGVNSVMAADPPAEPPPPPSQYPITYETPSVEKIAATLASVRNRLDSAVPPAKPGAPADRPLDFRRAPIAYPMGVIYAGMISAADATGDKAYADFVAKRFQLYVDTIAS